MPNTLLHIGIQGLGSRAVDSGIDLKWVFLGCLIPDLPWILRRVVDASGIGIDPYVLRLYTVVQASFLFCLLLSLAFAQLSRKPGLVFTIMAVNSLIHLLLDTLEIKWGNGVVLFAPLDWRFLSLELYWPDSSLVTVATLVSVPVIVWLLTGSGTSAIGLRIFPGRHLGICAGLIILYFILPLFLLSGPYNADITSIATLHDRENRIGKQLLMDRQAYRKTEDGDVVFTFAGEPLRVVGDIRATESSEISLIATFIAEDAIRIEQLHQYSFPWRNISSYAGLLVILVIWMSALLREFRSHPVDPESKP